MVSAAMFFFYPLIGTVADKVEQKLVGGEDTY